MTNVWCVRAESGTYTDAFVAGGYVAIGWGEIDLSTVKDRESLYPLYKQAFPDHTSNYVVDSR